MEPDCYERISGLADPLGSRIEMKCGLLQRSALRSNSLLNDIDGPALHFFVDAAHVLTDDSQEQEQEAGKKNIDKN
jgi:hypothetical protein